MSKSSDTLVVFALFVFLIVILIGALALLFFDAEDKGYDKGYCKALGGTVLNESVCDVGGKVVEIKE